jgi:hypothetical protein
MARISSRFLCEYRAVASNPEQHNNWPSKKLPTERFTARGGWKFTAVWFVSCSLRLAEKRQTEQMRWQIESLCWTDLARFSVWTGDGFARSALSAYRSNLQKWCTNVRLWSGFSDCQWLCCSGLGATAYVWGPNLLTFWVIYHFGNKRRSPNISPFYARADTAIQRIQMIQMIQMIQTSSEMHWRSVVASYISSDLC